MEPLWEIGEMPDAGTVHGLMEALNIGRVPATLLAQRGIHSYLEARAFFRPTLADLHRPMLMKDMEKAAGRVLSAIEQGQSILVYGDYDVDGTTAVALMYSLLRDAGAMVAFYIPDRYKEGYGVSEQGIAFAIDHSFDLMITLDCGIKAVETLSGAQQAGIDVIVCDHHTPGGRLPEVFSVLNPKREDCTYPYSELCGCGVGFKLLQAVFQLAGWDNQPLLQRMDLLAMAIGADIVPITGENRVLAHFGMQQINRQPSPGIAWLKELSGRKGKVNISDVVFYLAPRINAAGRMGHARTAVELLCSKSPETAESVARELDDRNTARKEMDAAVTEQALCMVAEEAAADPFSTVVYHPEWHKGIIGIVASRLIEHHYRPTVVLTRSNGVLTGSVRSIRGVNVYKALEACGDTLEQFGGHKYAAGLTLKEGNLDRFKSAFDSSIRQLTGGVLPDRVIRADMAWPLCDIDIPSYQVIKAMEPFGPGNMRPVFFADQVWVAGHKIIGKKHLRLQVHHRDTPHKTLTALAWGMVDKLLLIQQGKPLEIMYQLEENHWRGKTTLQAVIKGIRVQSGGV